MRRSSPFRPRRSGSIALVAAICGVLLLAVVAGGYYFIKSRATSTVDQPILHTVEETSFEHTVVEQGELESSSREEVLCDVRSKTQAGTTILSVIEEGAQVKEGDLLVTLDSSQLEDELTRQKIAVNASKAAKIQADSALEQAKIAKEEYLKGVYKQEEQLIESEILIAQEKVSRAQETEKYSRRLAAQGFLTDQQLQADIFAVKQASVELELAEAKLKTLQEITKKKMLVGFDADIEAAEAQLESQVSSLQEEEGKLKDISAQIAKCKIVAPKAGQVVHANKRSSRGGSEFIVEEGAVVRERQAIIYLPDPSQMQVKATINESRVAFVREGMPVVIRISAFDEGVLEGRVKKVNKYAEPTSWFSSQVKEYATFVEVVNPPSSIRTGMTAEVEIYVQKIDDAIAIPVQAVYETKGHIFVLVKDGNSWETREVKVGPSNEEKIVVTEKLGVGEQIAMNPRQHIELMNIPEDLEEVRPEVDSSKMVDPPKIDMSKVSKEMKGKAGAGKGGAGRGGSGRGRPGGAMAGRGGAGRGGAGRGGAGRGGPGAGRGGPGGGRGGAGGGRGGAGGGRGGFDMNRIVDMSMQRYDTDKDGKISKKEMDSMDADRKARLAPADTNGDGEITRAELKTSIEKMMKQFQGRGGGGFGGGRGGQ